jgi:hypothetical protein
MRSKLAFLSFASTVLYGISSRYMKSMIIVVATTLTLTVSANAQEWEEPTTRNGAHRTQVWAIGDTPDGAAHTRLSIQCYPGKRGYVAFDFAVRGAKSMKGFSFRDFEGPDAPARGKKLLTIIVQTEQNDIVIKTSVDGGLSGELSEPDTFQFTFGLKGKTNGDVSALIRAIVGGASSISITVEDNRDFGKKLHTVFPTTKSSDRVGQIMELCGKP